MGVSSASNSQTSSVYGAGYISASDVKQSGNAQLNKKLVFDIFGALLSLIPGAELGKTAKLALEAGKQGVKIYGDQASTSDERKYQEEFRALEAQRSLAATMLNIRST